VRAQRCADLERISASASRLEKELSGKTDELKTANNQLHVNSSVLSVCYVIKAAFTLIRLRVHVCLHGSATVALC